MSNPSRDWSWVQAHGTALMTAAGAVLIALVIIAVVLAARRASLASALRGIAIPLVLIWEGQGVYGVALRLHAPRELAYPVAGVMSAVVLALASFAHGHFERTEQLSPGGGKLGPNGRRMWYVAVFMGAVVAANAGSLTGAGLRVLLPVLSLVLFQAPYLPDEPAGKKDGEGSWRLTPRRLGVSLGLLDAADTDLTTVHAERLIRCLTRHSAGYHQGGRLRGWHARRLVRLALMADDAMIGEAAARVLRAHRVLAVTAPDAVAADLTAPVADAVAAPVGDSPAAPVADDSGGTSRDAITDAPREASGAPIGDVPAHPSASAVARVRRKGAGNASDDEIRAAIRELREADPDLTPYAVAKALKSSTRGTIGDRRAARILAEIEADARTVIALGSRRTAGE